MFYGNTVQETRQMFYNSWEKFQHKEPLSPLEHEIAQVILAHPEYHRIFENQEKVQEQVYFTELDEPNPFLHMGLHIAVREQVSSNRPIGIIILYKNLIKKYKDSQKVEHLIMEQLAQCLWHSQKNNMPPDEKYYLHVLSQL